MPGDAGTLCGARYRAHRDGAASGLAGAERFPALRLCRAPRAAVARVDRSCLAPAAVRGEPGVLLDPVAADRSSAALSTPQRERATGRDDGRRLRPAHRGVARLRPDGGGAGALRAERARYGGDVGLPALA